MSLEKFKTSTTGLCKTAIFKVKSRPIGDQAIEVIQWNTQKLAWDFIELTHNGRKVNANLNPTRCVMCHAGTPKPILPTHAEYYQGKLKPIFAQYPLWPGFYGSINDIVGVPGTSDTIMANESDTRAHINDFLFDDSEELARLRESLDKNPKYMNVVRHEMKIHQEHFEKFINSMADRPRYKHLTPLSELYTKTNETVPAFLRSAPYRRSFSKDYGHYILRPNFYLSSLMSFYQAQAIAREIMAYLLAYQYNLVHAAKTGTPHLPLFAWNLEGNEEIASYHYGNVFSDLNEIVLWNLAANIFPNIDLEDGRSAHEARHAEFNASKHLSRNVAETEIFVEALLGNLGFVSRFTSSQMDFATTRQKYYGQELKGSRTFKGLPVSKHCKNDFMVEAQKELNQLASSSDPLPHIKYRIDEKLLNIPQVPRFREPNLASATLKDKFLKTLDPVQTLPIPFGNLMPYGRRAMDAFSLVCESKLIENAYASQSNLATFDQKFNCLKRRKTVNGVAQMNESGSPIFEIFPNTPENNENCLCRSLYVRKHNVFKSYYHIE